MRDFLHVDDVVRAYIYLARRGVPGTEAYNITSGTGTSVADLVQIVLDEVAGGTVRVRVPGPGRRAGTRGARRAGPSTPPGQCEKR